jgi:putative ABC transport system substrate-binding protein
MRRRHFITFLGGAAAAWPLTVRAQKTPIIAWLDGGGQPRPDSLVAFRSGLSELGYVDGHNVAIEIHGVQQPEQLEEAITELMREPAAAIFVNASWKAVNAAKAATSTLPIVFAYGSGDPVKLGIVASLARPGGNVTGVSMYASTLVPKRLELLRKVMPQAATIAFLTNPSNLGSELDTMDVQAAARAMGQDLMVVRASTKEEIDHAFETIAQRPAGALLVDTDVVFNRLRDQLVALAARYRLPVSYSSRPYAAAGGLMSYSDDRVETLRQAGIYTGRVLKGDNPADLPVLLPTKFQFVINLKTAKSLGLDLQWRTVLAFADEVIE